MNQFNVRNSAGAIEGPCTAEQLRQMAADGRITAETAVQRVGGSGTWHRAASIRGLAFAAPPTVAPEGVPTPPRPVVAPAPRPMPKNQAVAGVVAAPTGHDPRALVGRVTRQVSEIAGTEIVERSHVKALFADVLLKHTSEDAESAFSHGLTKSTPELAEIETGFPSPWVYTRLIVFFGVAFAGLWFAWLQWQEPNLLPGLILLGSFAFPIATAVFFYECNVPRNISLFAALRMFMWGGVLSLVLSLALFQLAGRWNQVIGDSVAGFVEEPGKLAAVVLLAGFRPKYRWTLNGLCLGAAVAAGFAAFESAGYAMRILLETNSSRPMFDNIVLRAFLAPFSHVVWTAISAGALWRVRRDRPFEMGMLRDRRCLAPLVAVMLLHAAWNSSLVASVPLAGGYLVLGVIAWIIAIGLLLGGLKEIAAAKREL